MGVQVAVEKDLSRQEGLESLSASKQPRRLLQVFGTGALDGLFSLVASGQYESVDVLMQDVGRCAETFRRSTSVESVRCSISYRASPEGSPVNRGTPPAIDVQNVHCCQKVLAELGGTGVPEAVGKAAKSAVFFGNYSMRDPGETGRLLSLLGEHLSSGSAA